MCGRYFLTTPGELLADLFEAPATSEAVAAALVPRYNIAPTQAVPIVRAKPDGTRELASAHWGLVPHWAKERAIGNKLINARAETVAEKPSFRDAFRRRRCLIPADGYYEWKKDGPTKQPFVFRRKDRATIAFAGIWSTWKDPGTGEPLESCAILTTTPDALAATVHDRMPVILPAARFSPWLDSATPSPSLRELFSPAPADEMEAYAVSRQVNRPSNDSPALLEPIPT